MIAITNGKLVTPEGIISGYDLLLKGQIIFEVLKKEEREKLEGIHEVIDAQGGYVSPGFIDIHADYIEHIASPRPSSLMDFKLALKEAERELLTHGVTTMYHSLSLYKLNGNNNKKIIIISQYGISCLAVTNSSTLYKN